MYQLGLIGHPITQSLSPWIHKQFLTKANIHGDYSLYEFDPDKTSLNDQVTLLRNRLDGFNVTVPYKQSIVPYLDELDATAKAIGAVNTVVNDNGKLIGHNTDGIGYVRSLENFFPHLFTLEQTNVLIIGAGGAARGIYHALGDRGFTKIDVMNRTKQAAEEIAKLWAPKVESEVLSLNDVHDVIHTYDLIIQTTSVGMKPQSDEYIVQMETLKDQVVVSDIVYQPINTAFLQQAKALSANVHYGHTMLLFQAQFAFEIWTNKTVELGDMAEELQKILEGA